MVERANTRRRPRVFSMRDTDFRILIAEVGHYLARNGTVIDIIDVYGLANQTVKTSRYSVEKIECIRGRMQGSHPSSVYTWYNDGSYLPSGRPFRYDLIEKISPQTHPEHYL